MERRLKPKSWPEQEKPMFSGSNIHYEMAEKTQAIGCGWPRRTQPRSVSDAG